MNKNIERPPLRPLSANEGIWFMALDIDHYNSKPPSYLVNLRDDKEQTIAWVFGVTMEGNSVCAHIYGFLPYFYILIPPNLDFTR